MSGMESIGGSVRRNAPTTSSSSPSLNCTFLGSLSSHRGRDILSQLCLQIAQQSKLRHHFVERKDMDKMTRQFFNKSVRHTRNRSSNIRLQKPPETMPLEMKVFFVRDQLERIAEEQVLIRSSICLSSNCCSFFILLNFIRKWMLILPTT